MSEPINPDRAIFGIRFHSGVNLAASFADRIARERGIKVGLIPCADGGTSINQWMPGQALYDHAVMMARLAMRSSTLGGILWHQGESDCGSDEALIAHGEKFRKFICSLRKDLNADGVPLIIGELAEDIIEDWGLGNRPAKMNSAYKELAGELPCSAVASSAGLQLKPDGIHFNSKSLREFGERYAEKYLDLTAASK